MLAPAIWNYRKSREALVIERKEEFVCKEMLAGIKQGLGARELAFFFLSFCNENPSTHLQQDSASVESKIVIILCAVVPKIQCTLSRHSPPISI